MLTHNLPSQTTPFVGREEELAEIARLLADPACRLLTVVGPGGIGKTRLALKVGNAIVERGTKLPHSSTVTFTDGVYFVPLQPLISSDFNLSALVDALNIQLAPDGDLEGQVLRQLRSKSLLLILDNFEHLLDGAGLISRLLAHAAGIKVLVTSRAALNLQEEWLITVQGMSYPERVDHKGFEAYDAVQLFVGNARRLSPDFSPDSQREGIARICRLVEGMPLALELASSWTRSLSCSEIADELERGLDILETRASNVPERHRTMRTTLDHSWNLLSETEQSVFKKLSVFRGGFTREAAQMVAEATRHTLAKLVDKCWLRHDAAGRYDIHELLRQYGEAHLNEQPEEAMQTHDQHCSYYADFLAQRQEPLKGAKAAQALKDIETELENVRVYWDWAFKNGRNANIQSGVESLWHFYDTGVRFQEGEQAFAKAAEALRSSSTNSDGERLLGKVLARQGALRFSLGRLGEARTLVQESFNILQRFDAYDDEAYSLSKLAQIVLFTEHKFLEAREMFQAALALYQKTGNLWGIGDAISSVGLTYELESDFQMAWQLYQQSLSVVLQNGNHCQLAGMYFEMSRCLYKQKRYCEALQYARKSLEGFRELNVMWGIAMLHDRVGRALVSLGKYSEARYHALQAFTVAIEYGTKVYILEMMILVARLWSKWGKTELAVEFLSLNVQHLTNVVWLREDSLQLLAELEPLLPDDVFAAAVERGKARDFDMSVQEVMMELRELDNPSNALPDPLTEREVEVLRLVAEGRSNREIARELVLAVGTVKWYVSDIFSKLGVANRTQAAGRARELQLLS